MSTSLQANQLSSNNYLIQDSSNAKSQHHQIQKQTPKQPQQKQQLQQQHLRHNSYDGMLPPSQRPTNNNMKQYSHFDQTDDDDYESMPSRGATNTTNALPERQQQQQQHVSIKQQHQQNVIKHHHHNNNNNVNQQPYSSSPIKRSSSFNLKAHETRASSGTPKMHNKFMKAISAPTSGLKIQKSASSSCFKQITNPVDDDDDYENEFYINDDDDLNPNQFTPSDESEEEQKYSLTLVNEPPISNTRYNKTFLMRCEQSKSKVLPSGFKQLGVVACPNTPEMPRRDATARASMRDRASMPRDSSLGRILDKKPHSAGALMTTSSTTPSAVAKQQQQQQQQASNSGRVTSKYLDISKYKSERGNNFLKRDESKSYLNREVKKSSSSACLQNFQRDLARSSTRSSGGGTNSRPSSATTSAAKKKESMCLHHNHLLFYHYNDIYLAN